METSDMAIAIVEKIGRKWRPAVWPCADQMGSKFDVFFFFFFFVDQGKALSPSKYHYKWCFAGVPMMAQHWMLAW